MYGTIRDEIESYLVENFSHEAALEYMSSLMVIDSFEYQKPYDVFADILYDTTEEDENVIQMSIIKAFNDALDFILANHRVVLVEETDLETKNMILSALYQLQHVEDPVPFLRILEGYKSEEEKLALIIEILSGMDHTRAMMALESVEKSTLDILQALLYEKESTMNAGEADEEAMRKAQLIGNLKDFFHVCGEDNLAFEMSNNGIMPAHRAALYYPYIKDMIDVPADDDQTAKNILSLLYYAIDTFTEPSVVYRKVAENLIHGDPTRMMKIEAKISTMVNNLNQFQKAKNDAKSIFVVQHQA